MANEIGHVRVRSEAERIARLGLPPRHTAEYASRLGIPMPPPMPANPNRHTRRAFAKRLDAWARAERKALDALEAKAAVACWGGCGRAALTGWCGAEECRPPMKVPFKTKEST